MIEKYITVTLKDGLHARPAAEFVKMVRRFNSDITINHVNAKSILQIMGTTIKEGQSVHVKVTGDDEQDAMDWIEMYL